MPRDDPGRYPPATIAGPLAALSAFVVWGLSPLYYRALGPAGAVEILSHRIVWSLVLTMILVVGLGRWRLLVAQLRSSRRLGILTLSSLLVSINWLLFIWAVNNGRALEASMGYYIMPLVMLLLGRVFLDERLSRRQGAAVGLVVLGVGNLVIQLGALPWVALGLAVSFGFYSLVRKMAPVDAVVGLTVECLIVTPVALVAIALLAVGGSLSFLGGDPALDALLAGTSLMTALPLILFAFATKKLRLGTVGLMQYINPTVQFLLAVFVFGEPFGIAHKITFALIWGGLVLFSLPRRRQASS